MAVCPLCSAEVDPRVLAQSSRIRPQLFYLLRSANSAWQPADGACPACVHRAQQQFSNTRSATALHTTTDPQTTFPYYHPNAESVLAQAERLPDYATFTGQGVTIAFLDSGYYPHPDLGTALPDPEQPRHWVGLTERQWRDQLEPMRPRFAHYVDLADGGERLGVDQSSLWDSANDSWHGQMTTVVAAGNGALSTGRYRGYAPQAAILPIKIGRASGRIPEEDILRGLEWLLQADNWQRYGVRVLNVSVGGDFRQPWHRNAVCLAAEELSRRGMLICAAAGNSGLEGIVAPAQAPSVLTVGGYEDHNLRWQPHDAAAVARLTLYHHNYGPILAQRQPSPKPEILALARWLPAPILPVSPVLRETVTIGALRNALLGYEEYPTVPTRTHRPSPDQRRGPEGASEGLSWFPEVWQAVRQAMNRHKWVHPYYQHVDGTSVAVAQVSAVAAQMVAANPQLSGAEVRALLLATVLPLPNQPAERSGHGVLQPSLAVAAALRARGGALAGYPPSATFLDQGEWRPWLEQARAPYLAPLYPSAAQTVRPIYLGYYAPTATAVSVVGDFNGWQPSAQLLTRAHNGWWHGILLLRAGHYAYRFWVEERDSVPGNWVLDPENPVRSESGYEDDHTLLVHDGVNRPTVGQLLTH